MTGILSCVINGDDLTRCECFVQLALTGARTAVRKITLAPANDWSGLAAWSILKARTALYPSAGYSVAGEALRVGGRV